MSEQSYEKSMAFCKIEGIKFEFQEPRPGRKDAMVTARDPAGAEVGSLVYAVEDEDAEIVRTTRFTVLEESNRRKGIGTALASALTEYYPGSFFTESGYEEAYSEEGTALLKSVREQGIQVHPRRCFVNDAGVLNCSCELSKT